MMCMQTRKRNDVIKKEKWLLSFFRKKSKCLSIATGYLTTFAIQRDYSIYESDFRGDNRSSLCNYLREPIV